MQRLVSSLSMPCRLDNSLLQAEQLLPLATPDWSRISKSARSLSSYSSNNEISKTARFGVIFHCYFPCAHVDILQHLLCLNGISCIVFTTDTAEKVDQLQSLIDALRPRDKTVRILLTTNLGRDVLPFFRAFQLIEDDCDVFLKLHYKLTPYEAGTFGHTWSYDIYNCLVPVVEKDIISILDLFSSASLACLYPRPWPLRDQYGWCSTNNLRFVAKFIADHGYSLDTLLLPLVYPVGNMFIGSTSFFKLYANYFLTKLDYPSEPIPTDGTCLHAVERCYSFLAAAAGLSVASIYPGASSNFSPTFPSVPFSDRMTILFPVAGLMKTITARESSLSLSECYFSAISIALARFLTASPSADNNDLTIASDLCPMGRPKKGFSDWAFCFMNRVFRR